MANKQKVHMQLPFAPQQAWRVNQGNYGTTSHYGINAFCWDFALPQGSSRGQPVYASAAGEVVDVHATEGWFYIKHAEGEFCAYLHCIPNSLKFKLGDRVQMGQELAQVGNTAPGEKLVDHLHIALSNVVGLLPYGSTPNFTTIPAEFMEYDVFNEGTSSWDFVNFGVPQEGRIVVRRSRWGPWTPLGGEFPAMTRPTVVSRKPNIIDIMMRGMDNRLWQLSWVGGASPSWTNWMPHDDGFVLNSDPVVDSMAPNHLHVFAVGDDRRLWQKWYFDGKGWSSWIPHTGGEFPKVARPSAISRQPTITEIVIRGVDNRLWQESFVAGANPPWSGWMPHNDGFELHSDPVVDSMAPDRLHVFALGADKQLWQKWYIEGKGWSGWMKHGGEFSEMSSAGVVSRQTHITDVVMRGMDNGLWGKSFVGGGNPPWTGWMPHKDGFELGSDPAAVSTGANHLCVLALGADRQLWLKHWIQ